MTDLLTALKEERTRLLAELKVVEAHIATKLGTGKPAHVRNAMSLAKKKYWADVRAGKVKRKGYKVKV
jgi:hypothetical protein